MRRGMVMDERMMKNEMLKDEMMKGDMKKDEMKMGEMKKGMIERGLLKRDAGVSTALGTVLLLVIVVIVAALACVAVFSAADAGNTHTPVVFFSASANEHALYHAGGEALSIDDIRIFSGSRDITAKTLIYGEPWSVWKTGDLLDAGEGNPASSLTIVYKNGDILY
ncbi:MAG: type IV pilin [Methanocorpusculum sp.]|nr:type IV pilin [Methanocorpusculum sp.]